MPEWAAGFSARRDRKKRGRHDGRIASPSFSARMASVFGTFRRFHEAETQA